MENNNRKATEVLLSIESKIDTLLTLYKALSFDIKILSNKVNSMMEQNIVSSAPIITGPSISSDDEEKFVEIKQEETLPITDSPVGFRRTSRPETYATEPAIPAPPVTEFKDYKPSFGSPINVVQRVVDKNGKSLFLAEVEILPSNDSSLPVKTRTNASGKWQAQLLPGEYKVFIRKRESVTKDKIETLQTINVDGSESLLNLDMLIIK